MRGSLQTLAATSTNARARNTSVLCLDCRAANVADGAAHLVLQ